MWKNVKISILAILIIIITFIIIRQSQMIHTGFKNIEIPTKENREFGNMSTYKWLTVKKLSQKYDMSEHDIFKALKIIPHKGDENIPIRELAKKHNKNPEEVRNDLKKIIENHRNVKGKKI